jgi:drug/metabolite transporter (DMT)-like permease
VSFREQLVAAIVLLPFMVARHEPVDVRSVCSIAAIGVICTAFAFSMFVAAQRYLSAQTAGISAGMETVYSIIFAFLFLGEAPSVRDIIGGVVILGVALASSLSAGKKDMG